MVMGSSTSFLLIGGDLIYIIYSLVGGKTQMYVAFVVAAAATAGDNNFRFHSHFPYVSKHGA